MPPLWALINEVSQQISTVSDNPHFEAELLLANAFKITRAELLSRVREEVFPPPILYHWIERRKEHEPIAYILGYTEFYGIKIRTVPPIFIPRPETELLVEETLKIIEKLEQEPITILEPCTGTGCISIAISKYTIKKIFCVATDINEKAVILAQQNARDNNVCVNYLITDLFTSISTSFKFDVIVVNPPYISEQQKTSLPKTVRDYEDARALFSPNDGMGTIQKIVLEARKYLKIGGWLLLEIGDGQKEPVERLFQQNGYVNIQTLLDLQKLPRLVKAQWKCNMK